MAGKGVIVEFDFAVLNGAELLFQTTRDFLARLDGIAFDEGIEARYMAGGNYQGAFSEYFAAVKTKKTPQKAARDLTECFRVALNAAVPAGITTSFRNFVKALVAKDVKVVITTRADIAQIEGAFAGLLGEKVVLFHEESSTYGGIKWDAWRRACVQNGLRSFSTLAVTGSGNGVKSALIAGMGSVAVPNAHVAYQDFGGADAVVKELNAAAAKAVLEILRV